MPISVQHKAEPIAVKPLRVYPTGTKPRGLGDIVSAVVTPIAKALGHPCVDGASGELKKGSPCDKRKEWLNELTSHKQANGNIIQ